MGVTVRQKAKGKGEPWWVFITHNGRRTSRQVGSKSAAEEVASKIQAKLKLGEFNFEEEKPIPTFREYAESWLKTTVAATCKDSTAKEYKDVLNNHILPVFENLEIPDITRGKIKDFLHSKVNAEYSASRVNTIKNVISCVLNKSVDDNVIPYNVAYKLGKLTERGSQNKAIDPSCVLTEDELKLLLDTVKEHFPQHYPLFLLLARTGMRIGEALALQWGDIDFNGRFITIQRNLSRNKIQNPKSGKARSVDMSPQLSDALLELKEKREEENQKPTVIEKGKKVERIRKSEWVFTNECGSLIDKSNWRKHVLNPALDKAGVRRITIHGMRHTYATIRLSRGHSIEDVSKQLGHHSVKLTWDTYYHWKPGTKKHQVDALDDPDYRRTHLHPIRTQEPAKMASG